MSVSPRRRLLMIEQGGRGGVADYTGELVRALADVGWTVELATADDHLYPAIPGVVIHPVFHYVRDDSVLGRTLRRAHLGPVVNGLRFLASMPQLVRLSRNADIVHSQGWEIPEIGLVAIACMRLGGVTMVQTLHGIVERSGRLMRTRRLITRMKGRLTARTIVHTRADLALLAPGMRALTAVIPHGEYGGLARTGGSVERAGARAQLGIPTEAPVTLLFGQLRADKGLGDLVAALARLPALHLLVGGQDLGALSALAEQLASPQLAGRVTIREGFLDMGEAAQLFAAADTVALPYPSASQSGVLLLAYGFHRPVVAYPVGGLVEAVIDGETGWLCSRADVDALVDALAASIEAGAAECLRRGEQGARLADERFSWPVIARRTDEVYGEVLARV
ncbi:MAG TPA: glycosyltransferase family 4 protein [Solirubrobacteraceae bacterium]|nr:glycosyltransferase family 4 protein [Solirubrobacteraceae bacterium]